MKVLQLIDSLRPGGAERMAVNLANALVKEAVESYVVVTRLEGVLAADLNKVVQYKFLAKKDRFDIGAFLKLRRFISENKIDIVHAHGTSWFFGVLLKLSGIKIKLIWHDHYGESEFLEERSKFPICFFSNQFDGIVVVNANLKRWNTEKLKLKNIIQLNNFISENHQKVGLKLKGEETDFRIICVANFRPQKDHFNLLESLDFLSDKNISLHLFGKGFNDDYEAHVLEKVKKSDVSVYIYKNQMISTGILKQAHLGVLSSRSEGLPLAILEYGLAGLPVVCTDVGQCREVLSDFAQLVPPGNSKKLAEAIIYYLENEDLRKTDAKNLEERIGENYTAKAVIPELLSFYNSIG